MYAIEFEADLKDGVLTIPDTYKSLSNQDLRVVMLLENPRGDPELRALSNHSAAVVSEWRDPAEDRYGSKPSGSRALRVLLFRPQAEQIEARCRLQEQLTFR